MADRPRGTEETPSLDLLTLARRLLADAGFRERVRVEEEMRRGREERHRVVFYGDYPGEGTTTAASSKARGLLIHVLGEQAYTETQWNQGWTPIRSRLFPQFNYWLNIRTPTGFNVCRFGEGPGGMIAARICIQAVTYVDHYTNLPVEDAAVAMYLLAAYQEDRLLTIGNPDREWWR